MIMPVLALAQNEVKPQRHYDEFDGKVAGSGYDDFTLSSGFGSRYSWGMGGGKIKASRFGDQCVGWIPRYPNHTITVQRSSVNMTLTAVRGNNPADLSMLIKGPNDRILCDDNSADGVNPKISAEFPPGEYQVFIANSEKEYHLNNGLALLRVVWIIPRDMLRFLGVLKTKPERTSNIDQYYLEIIEDGHQATHIAATAQHDTQGRNGNFNIGAGFTPQTATGLTGNPEITWMDAAEKFGTSCSGVLHSRPDHRLTVTSAVNLNLAVSSVVDSSLVLSGPAGTFCADNQVNALLTPGEYEIYVGSFGDSGEYMVTASENK